MRPRDGSRTRDIQQLHRAARGARRRPSHARAFRLRNLRPDRPVFLGGRSRSSVADLRRHRVASGRRRPGQLCELRPHSRQGHRGRLSAHATGSDRDRAALSHADAGRCRAVAPCAGCFMTSRARPTLCHALQLGRPRRPSVVASRSGTRAKGVQLSCLLRLKPHHLGDTPTPVAV